MRSLALVFLVVATIPAAAQDQPVAEGRFTAHVVPDGLIRLDNRTGEVSHCRREGEAWVCRLVPDDRRALDNEVARLEQENAELRARLAGRGPTIEVPRPRLPTEQEMNEALSFMERFLERARRMMERWREAPPDRT